MQGMGVAVSMVLSGWRMGRPPRGGPGGRQHLTGSSGGCYIAIDVVGAARESRDELQLRFQRFRRFLCHRIE